MIDLRCTNHWMSDPSEKIDEGECNSATKLVQCKIHVASARSVKNYEGHVPLFGHGVVDRSG